MKSFFRKSCTIELILILLGWIYPLFMPTSVLNIQLNGNGLAYLPWLVILIAIIGVPAWGCMKIYINNQVQKQLKKSKKNK